MAGHIYNIPLSCPFMDVLAERFGRMYADNLNGLADVLFLLPNRRACLSLREAFIRYYGLKPVILPKIVPIGDLEEDEVFFNTLDNLQILEQLPPAMNEYERLFLFSRLIVSKPAEYGLPEMSFSQAFALARDLAKFMDVSYNERLSFSRLKEIVPEQYAAHWQDTLNFLKILTEHWPRILEERGLVDSVYRKNRLLEIQAQIWREKYAAQKIVAAGTTGAFPGLRQLLQALLTLPEGEVYLYGIDKFLDDEDWQQVDESHPQYEIKQLLEFLNVSRHDVVDLLPSHNGQREKFLSEVMRPAPSTVKWRALSDHKLPLAAFQNLHLVECADTREEAAAIAVLLRETLNTPEKTAALVTSDRNLARRTASELERWGIKIDDSAGRPLHLMPIGIFLRTILYVMEEQCSDRAMLTLAKNPFVRLGYTAAELRTQIRRWEKAARQSLYSDQEREIPAEWTQWQQRMKEILYPLFLLYQQPTVDVQALVMAHIKVAEQLSSEGGDGEDVLLWRGEDGKAAANMFSDVLPYLHILGSIECGQYSSFLTSLMSSLTIRSNFGTHPRLKILGPIEARFNQYDTVIIGGVNEGVWPKIPGSDPWLSHPMKKDFGMPLPEKAIGVMAADFSQLMCAPEVYITRSTRVNGTPAAKSRWQLRLETVLDACGIRAADLTHEQLRSWTRRMDEPQTRVQISAPAPCPPVAARPRRLSASSIEMLMRDPYQVYAAKILRLKPLEDLDKKLLPSDYGNIVHKILETFNRKFPTHFPDNAREELLKIGVEEFKRSAIAPEIRAFWWPDFEKTVDWLILQEQNYRRDIYKVYPEAKGSVELNAPCGKFVVEARADRIDLRHDGTINILDYKTGEPRSAKEVYAGYAPQLPIEALIAENGGFILNSEDGIKAVPQGKANDLIYWKLGSKKIEMAADQENLLAQTFDRLQRLISVFDFETTPYLARPNPKHIPKYSDYEHLARVKEWSTEEDDGE